MPGPARSLSPAAQQFKLGTYRHFKGGMYTALYIARSADEREEEFVSACLELRKGEKES